ncbi:LysR family transcriptional regulator [Qipengyuania sp. MTN3-11]|uniref:LysR family transcriptional regulator n=1 Tax=Qipengyuania sp. MTN3-11 TaxID=3056557 RepID=UPI0036F31B2B
MIRPYLPLNGLRAFEAVARHSSFTHAATELHVTPAALNHRLRGLAGRRFSNSACSCSNAGRTGVRFRARRTDSHPALVSRQCGARQR